MIKRALAVALLGIGFGCVADMPASAATLSMSGIGASAARIADDNLVRVGGGTCFELPVVGAVEAFVELLTDEERDPHCAPYYEAYPSQAHDERKYVSEKDTGYARPKDLKATPR